MRINQLSESNYIDAEEAEDNSRGLIPPTKNNLNKFLQFLKEKWTERSKQRYDSWGNAQDKEWQPPTSLEGACKFTSLFALKLFGGRMRGNEHHQYLELPNGKIIDPVPVPEMKNPQYHDEAFWLNPEHKQSLESCLPRVKGWVNEFMSMNESQIIEMNDRNRLPDNASWYKGAFPFSALRDDNRRFMFNPVTGTFVIGERDVLGKGNGVPESHDSEFKASGAPGSRHDYMISGWVGIGGKYKNGVIHFAPPIFDMDMEDQAVKQAAMSTIEGFKKSGANKNTILRNFGTRGERKLGSVTEAVITELTKGVKKGSQKREKIGFASDDPSKYVGKWEEYTEPQGINSKAGKKMTKTESSITELFDRSSITPISWKTSASGSRGTFDINGTGFDILVSRTGKNTANFDFAAHSMFDETDLSGKDKITVLNTVFAGVKEFLDKNQEITTAKFLGSTPSRVKLYHRMASRFSGDAWDVSQQGDVVTLTKRGMTEGVVDNIVFYHGQPRPEGGQIEQFELPRGDDGIYFSNNADYAMGYATEFRAEKPDPSVDEFAKTGVAYPVYLDLKNPLILNGEDEAVFEKYTQRGFKRSEVMAQGYDGIILKYDDGEIEAQAYDPRQIKTAIGEAFNYSPEFREIPPNKAQNIVKSAGGEIVYAIMFPVDDAQYIAYAEKDTDYPGLYSFSFNEVHASGITPEIYEPTGNQNPMRVYSGAMKALSRFVKKYKPSAVHILASTWKQSDIYKKIVNKIDLPGYDIDKRGRYPVEGMVLVRTTMGEAVIKEEIIKLYRGINSGQEGNSYYSPDKEWARQFTQSGRDEEIKTVRYSTNRIYRNNPLPKAYGLDDSDIEIMNKAWDAGYKGIWMDEGNGQPDSVYFMRARPSELFEGSIGPQRTRGLSNSSTGLGAAPPQIVLDQTPWQKKTNGKQKMAGHKAPKMVVRKNVRKSTKNTNRKLNSKVTEVFGDSSNSFPYENDGGWTSIDTGIEGLEVVVGMEDIKNYNQDLPPGVNVGMVTQTEDGIHMGIEPAKVGMTTKDTIKLFNTLMNIVREYVETNDPDRLYFVAVKPMEGIYKRLIRRFVNTDEWNIKIIKDVPIPMIGTKLNAYMIEKKNLVTEMYRVPKHSEFDVDYEVVDGEEIVAKGTVNAGVIDEFMVRDDVKNNDFRGKYMSGLMSAIVRDADLTNSNVSMQIYDQNDLEMKRFLERFGFRHVGDGVFRRTAGAITPPSVIY